jgi:RHS repeat-associated protein
MIKKSNMKKTLNNIYASFYIYPTSNFLKQLVRWQDPSNGFRGIRGIILAMLTICSLHSSAQNINRQNIPCPMGMYVNSFNGNLHMPRTDLFIEGRMIPFNLTFYYNSNNHSLNLGYGKGWGMEYLMKYVAVSGGILMTRGDGYGMLFEQVAGGYKAPKGVFDSLVEYQSGKFKLITKEKTIYFFDEVQHKRMTRMEEIHGNFLNFSYADSMLTQITDAASRSIQLVYQDGKLKEINDALSSPLRKIQYKYDSNGNLTEVEDPLGNKIKYSYLLNGPLNKLTDKNSNAADIVYNAAYQVKEIISCNGSQRFSYDKAKGLTMMVEQVSGQNQVTTYRYNSQGEISQKEGNCCGFNTKFEYDNGGNITKFTNANGHASTFTYDSKGNMLSKTDPLGNTLHITWNSLGKVKSFTDKNGNTTTFDLNNKGDVTKATYPEGVTNEFTYAANGDLLTSKDGNGNITTYMYDNYGNVLTIQKPLSVTYGGTYDARSRLLTVTDPNSNTTTFNNDLLDRITSVTDAASHAISIAYDANDNVISYTDRNGHATTMVYDAADRLITATNAIGNSVHGKYDEHNNLKEFTDEKGNITKLTYDNLNRLTKVSNAANEVTQYAYAPNGKLINMVYPNGNNVTITRDAQDRITQISDNIGTISQRQYDAKGNLVSLTNALGNTTNFIYDNLNRLTKRSDPMNFSEEYTYDNNFNVLSFKDKNGHIKSVAYNALNRATGYTDALGFITSYVYDPAGNLTSITDAKGNTTNYTYNNLNRQTATAYAIGPGNSSTYDNNGNVLTYTDGNGVTTNYVYDAIDQLTKMDFPGADDYEYAYDAAGNLITATNADAIVNFVYDAVNRITSESLNGKTTAYTYNIAAGQFSMIYPSGRNIKKTFDARNRLASITESSQQLFSAIYDDANQVTTQNFGNGGTANFNYDAGGRLLTKFSNSIPPVGFQYTYDNAGNITSETKIHKPDHSEQYFYDNEDQLIEWKYGTTGGNDTAHHQKFIYDQLGNRTTATFDGNTISYTSNQLNQYTSVDGVPQTFNGNGSLISSGAENYSYNTIDQLTNVNATTFKYDALNRLVKVATASDSITYDYSFLNAVEIKKQGFDISNVFVGGLDDLVNIKKNGQDYFAMQNNVNSVTSLTDNTNHIIEFYEYEPFGANNIFNNLYSGIGSSSIGNELQFGGRNKIASTEIYYFRFRYLDTQHGRFIQKDPLEYIDGMNIYSFVINNPNNLLDPLGLDVLDPESGLPYNSLPPKTIPTTGENMFRQMCLSTCLLAYYGCDPTYTGGKEGKPYHKGRAHPENRACDIGANRNPCVTDRNIHRCAKNCGYDNLQYEVFPNSQYNHWHISTGNDPGVPPITDNGTVPKINYPNPIKKTVSKQKPSVKLPQLNSNTN